MRPKRVDQNQPKIVKAFRDEGCTVYVLSMVGKGFPDIIVGLCEKNYLVEIKNGDLPMSSQKLTPPEEEFFSTWKGQVCIVRNPQEVKELVDAWKNDGIKMLQRECKSL